MPGPIGIRASLEAMVCECKRVEVLYNSELSTPVSSIHELICDAFPDDKTFGVIWSEISSPKYVEATSKYSDRYVVCDKLLFMRYKTSFRLCVLRAVQTVLLKEFNDTPVAGHMGIIRIGRKMVPPPRIFVCMMR